MKKDVLISLDQLINILDHMHNSKYSGIFNISFIKRTTGDLREMTCRFGVTKHLKNGEAKYSFKDKNLLCVFDMQKNGYRTINLDAILAAKINHINYKVK